MKTNNCWLGAILLLFISTFLLSSVSCIGLETVSNSTTSTISMMNNLKSAKMATQKVINLVHQRFELMNKYRLQFFLGSSNMPSYAWDILKYKFAMKMLDKNSIFLMIFGGSSVTAGHDNYFNQSYPIVFERRMKSIFSLLNINLKVHNIAQGANNCRPSNYCYDAMGGINGKGNVKADFIGWEQSFNCGRDNGIFELMARTAYWNKAVIYYVASGAFSSNGCKPSTDPLPYIDESWTPEIAGITDTYYPIKENVTSFKEELNRWYEDGNSVARFVDPLRGDYKGVGPHGFSVWGKSRLCINDLKNNTAGCTAIEIVGKCFDQGGPHWMVEEACRYGADGGKGASWHPPVGMHLMRGETLVYNYAHIMLDAIMMVEADIAKEKAAESKSSKSSSSSSSSSEDEMNPSTTIITSLIKGYQSELDKLQIPIPDATTCKTKCHCRFECETQPLCYTNYKPHYNSEFSLDSMIVGNHTGWASVSKDGSGRDSKKYGYLDERPCYEGKGSNSTLFLKIEIRENSQSFAKVCGYNQKESLKHAQFYLDPNISNPGPDYIPSANRIRIQTRRYVNDECTQLNDLPIGKHVLTVMTDPNHPNHLSSLTHLILFS